jgi:hypothetical protein
LAQPNVTRPTPLAESAEERLETDQLRDEIAHQREETAHERDRLADTRDRDGLEDLQQALRDFGAREDSGGSEPAE